MKRSTLYTRTGDDGTTSLVGGYRVPKNHIRIEAYGTIDELNAQLGLLHTYLSDATDATLVRWIQHRLFAVGTLLATPSGIYAKQGHTHTPQPLLTEDDIAQLEQAIDRLDALLPPVRAFLLPGGNRASAMAQVARTVCRRAERHICALSCQETVAPVVVRFVNRLSDFLFVLSRKLVITDGQTEIIWEKDCSLEFK